MKKKKRWIAVILIIVMITLSACGTELPEPTAEATDVPTVGDMFTQPTTDPTEGPTQNTEPTETVSSVPDEMETTYCFFFEDVAYSYDDTGPYLTYEGGEMAYSFRIAMGGKAARNGVGLVLYLDGKLQPYRVEGSEEYAMVHTFYPGESLDRDGATHYTIYFTPVTGAAGDCLSLNIAGLDDPDYTMFTHGPTNLENKLSDSFRAGFGVYRVKFNADPEQQPGIEYEDRAIHVSTEMVETTTADVGGWSDADYRTRLEYTVSVNGLREQDMSGCQQYETPADEPVDLHLEIWGRAGIRYAVFVYADCKPVSLTNDGESLIVETAMGYKNVIDVSLDISDTDGETAVFVHLVPLNTLEFGEGGLWVIMKSSGTFFIYTESSEEIYTKY